MGHLRIVKVKFKGVTGYLENFLQENFLQI